MSDTPIDGGAGPALAAHSKDAATPSGPTEAARTAPDDQRQGEGMSETVSRLSDQARQAGSRMGASLAESAGTARQAVSDHGGQIVDQTTTFVREQPFAALALTAVGFFALGVLIARR